MQHGMNFMHAATPLADGPLSLTRSNETSQATGSSAVSREMEFSACHHSNTNTDGVSPFSNGFFLSEDGTVGVSSTLTTAATSLVHVAGLREDFSREPQNSTEHGSPVNVTSTTAEGPSCASGRADFCGFSSSASTTAMHTGTQSMSVLHAATAAAASDAPPALPHSGPLLRPATATDANTLLTTSLLSTTEAEALAAAPKTHNGGGRSVAAAVASRGPTRTPLRLHWCCAAHWRAVRRMERGVQAPAAADAEDVYCVPAHVRRPRRDSRDAVHSASWTTKSLAVRTLPPFFSISLSSLPRRGTSTTSAQELSGHADAEDTHAEGATTEDVALTCCCEFCGRAVEALEEVDAEAETSSPSHRNFAAKRSGGAAALAVPLPLQRLRGHERAGGLPLPLPPAQDVAAKAAVSSASNVTGGSNLIPVTNSDTSVQSASVEAASPTVGWPASTRDAAMMAAVAMF